MLDLDYRIGSGELLNGFKPFGISVQKTTLAFGDMAWEGNGPNGLCRVGVERKKIDDLLQSIQDQRLSGHQLPGMVDYYDYGYLVVEGVWKPGDGGQLMVWDGARNEWKGRGVMARAIHNYLTTLSVQCGVMVWRTAGRKETVEYVVDQYRYWREKRWEEHRAHQGVYLGRQEGKRLRLGVRELGAVEKVALVMPGVGAELAYRVGKKFDTVRGMCEAEAGKWAEVKGIGKKGGERLRGWLNGEAEKRNGKGERL